MDFLTKKVKRNEGEVPQYYVENDHEAIVSPAVFDMVQTEIAKRKKEITRYSGVSIFSNKIKLIKIIIGIVFVLIYCFNIVNAYV